MLAVQGFANTVMFAILGLFSGFFLPVMWFYAALFAGGAVLSTTAPTLGRVAMIGVWSMLAFMTFPLFLSVLTSGLTWALLVPLYVAAGLVGAFFLPSGPMPSVPGAPPSP